MAVIHFAYRDQDYIDKLNALAAQAQAALSVMPRQALFEVVVGSDRFELPGVPINGVVWVSVNGVLEHNATVDGQTVVLNKIQPPGYSVMVIWWE